MTFRRLAVLLAVVPLALVACADVPTGTGTGAGAGIDHATGPNDLVLQVSVEGGFVPVEWTYKNIPTFSLYGDGTIVLPGAQIELYPGPALPAISTRRVTESGIQAILEETLAAIDGVPDQMTDMGSVGIADVPTTVITVKAGGVDRTIHVYALSELAKRPNTMSGSEFRARARLQELVTKLGTVDSWLPDGSLGPEVAYEATAARLFVSDYRRVDLPQEPMAWPLDEGLGSFGAPTGPDGSIRCGVVGGQGWSSVLGAASHANELTPWTDDGSRFSILFRPLLPEETGC